MTITWTNETRTLRQLIPHADNPRRITEAAGERLKHSKRKFEQPIPILIDADGNLHDGHQRLDKWTEEWGLDLEVAVRVSSRPLSDAERKELVTLLHVGAVGEFDPELLSDWGVDSEELEEWGMDEETLAEVLEAAKTEPPPAPEAQVSRADELQEKWNVELGQLWSIGDHKLICGDCTDAAVVARVMGGELADLLLTDPPYGVKRDKGFEGFGGFGPPIARRQYSDTWDKDRPGVKVFVSLLAIAEKTIIFGGNFFADILPRSYHWIVWDKLNTMPTFGDCELLWTNIDRKSVRKFTIEYNGLIGKEKERYHPTQKPVGLYEVILNEYSEKGDVVFDGYAGSGALSVACERLGRKARMIEIEPKYCAVILERLSGMDLKPQRIE